jgi:hypothetical protein
VGFVPERAASDRFSPQPIAAASIGAAAAAFSGLLARFAPPADGDPESRMGVWPAIFYHLFSTIFQGGWSWPTPRGC